MFHTITKDIPVQAGAYILVIDLASPLEWTTKGKLSGWLTPGRYLYCGSARGPGGLRARIGRHLRPDKKPHWHIDQLTTQGHCRGAWVYEDGNECALVEALSPLPHPLLGFGATDCPRCPSHLLFWTPQAAIDFSGQAPCVSMTKAVSA